MIESEYFHSLSLNLFKSIFSKSLLNILELRFVFETVLQILSYVIYLELILHFTLTNLIVISRHLLGDYLSLFTQHDIAADATIHKILNAIVMIALDRVVYTLVTGLVLVID